MKFYLGDLHNAADVFARNAETFETKFGGPASEERIWRDACELKYLNMMSKQERKKLETGSETSTLLRVIPENESDDSSVSSSTIQAKHMHGRSLKTVSRPKIASIAQSANLNLAFRPPDAHSSKNTCRT